MLNPFDPSQSGSSLDLPKRVLQNMQSARIDDLLIEAVQEQYEKALSLQNVILSSLERERLLHQVMKAILTDMLKKLEDAE